MLTVGLTWCLQELRGCTCSILTLHSAVRHASIPVQAPIDDKTKTLLIAAVGLLAAVGALAGGKLLVDTLQNRITSAGDQVTKLVIGGAFWLVVFVAARTILDL